MAHKKDEAVAHEEALAPDPLMEALKKLAAVVEKNLKVIVASFAGVLALIVAVQFFAAQSERDASEITSELSTAIKAYEEATEPTKILSSTVAGALDEELGKARQKFQTITSNKAGSGAAQLALLYEADLARRLKKHEEAAELYKSYLKGAKGDDVLLFIALEGAGYALEEAGKLDEALEHFGKLGTDGPTAFYKAYGLKHRGRVLEKKGDKAGAVAAYQAIIAIEPASELKGFAEERVKLLQ